MRPVEAAQARPRPSAARFGRCSGPSRNPARSPAPRGAGLGDMAERIGAGIAIGGGILGAADADRIEHDDQRARHGAVIPGRAKGPSPEPINTNLPDAADAVVRIRRHRRLWVPGSPLRGAPGATRGRTHSSALRGRRSGRRRPRCRPTGAPGRRRCRARARVSAGIEAWVMIAGCSIRLSTPPRLSASANSSHALEEAPRAGEAALEHDR